MKKIYKRISHETFLQLYTFLMGHFSVTHKFFNHTHEVGEIYFTHDDMEFTLTTDYWIRVRTERGDLYEPYTTPIKAPTSPEELSIVERHIQFFVENHKMFM